MKHRILKTVCLTTLLLPFSLTHAGAPEGHMSSIEPATAFMIKDILRAEGYNDQRLRRNISAFLWDNRKYLKNLNIPNHRQVDLAICLIERKGHHDLSQLTNNEFLLNWCDEQITLSRFGDENHELSDDINENEDSMPAPPASLNMEF